MFLILCQVMVESQVLRHTGLILAGAWITSLLQVLMWLPLRGRAVLIQ